MLQSGLYEQLINRMVKLLAEDTDPSLAVDENAEHQRLLNMFYVTVWQSAITDLCTAVCPLIQAGYLRRSALQLLR